MPIDGNVSSFQPLQDWVLLDPIPMNETIGGIAIPDRAEFDLPRALVVAAGPGKFTEDGAFIEMNVKPGDVVVSHCIYNPPAFVRFGTLTYVLVKQRDLVGKIS